MGKVILFSRVSTEQQDLESQNGKLLECALRQGYNNDDIITIANKESGVKLSFIEREGLQELIKTIEDEPLVERVICWEVSRIARVPSIYYKVRDILIEKKIQLQVITPPFELLNPDGSINEQASLIIGIFISLSESEARLMKQRMARGKEKIYAEGKYTGGNVTFGYYVDNKGYLAAEPHDAETVKMIFDMYANRKMSCFEIAKEMMGLGLLWHKKISAMRSYIFSLVRNSIYATGSSEGNYNYRTRKGLVNTKPQKAPKIISMDLWTKAQERNMAENPYKAKRQRKNVYYAHGIIYDRTNGAALGPDAKKRVYRTSLSDREAGKKMVCINIDMVDSLLWHITKGILEASNEADKSKVIEKLRKAQSDCFLKISTLKRKQEELEGQISRIEERIISGRLDEVKGNEMQEKRYDEMTGNEVEITRLEDKAVSLQEEIEKLHLSGNIVAADSLDEEYRKQLVQKYISKVEVQKHEGYMYCVFVDGEEYLVSTHYKTRWIKKGNEIVQAEILVRK